jgi:hypothetical protein
MDASATHMQQPVRDYATKEFLQLRETMRVDEALQLIRHHRSTRKHSSTFMWLVALLALAAYCKPVLW